MEVKSETLSSRTDRGVALIEGALLIALIAVTAMMGARAMGTTSGATLDHAKNELIAAGSFAPPCDDSNPDFPWC
jgi:hypothetical protein